MQPGDHALQCTGNRWETISRIIPIGRSTRAMFKEKGFKRINKEIGRISGSDYRVVGKRRLRVGVLPQAFCVVGKTHFVYMSCRASHLSMKKLVGYKIGRDHLSGISVPTGIAIYCLLHCMSFAELMDFQLSCDSSSQCSIDV